MSRRRARLGLIYASAGLLLGGAGPAAAGAFIFAEDFADAITYPQVYSGSGGELADLTVCLDRSVSSSTTQRAEPAVIKAVDTYNRGRSLGADSYALNSATDIDSGFDFESVLLHELGHCQGLNHVNHASESGLSDPQANGSKSDRGGDGVFNQGAGGDGIHGSRDDLRGDDVNLHWYLRGLNNPGLFLATADSSTMARELSFLPSGQRFAANADRSVMAALGVANSEAVMQQGTPPREAKRHLHHDDLMTLRLARSGLNRVQGDGDDFRYRLRYVGRLFNPSNADCNVRIRIDNSTGFAVCAVGAVPIGGNSSRWRIAQAHIAMNSAINWYYSDGANTQTEVSSTSPNPSPLDQSYSVNVRVREASGISISGNPFGSVEVDDGRGQSCSFELTSAMNGQGSCALIGLSGGARTIAARFFGRGGYDFSEGSASHSVSSTLATLTEITGRSPSSTVVGQNYTVSARVTAASGTPTGSVSISDGSSSCAAALSSGSMSCELVSAAAGTRTLTASYAPTGSFGVSSGSASHTVGRARTSVQISSALPDPSAFGQPVSVAFQVRALSPSSATPSGSVAISVSGGSEACTASAPSGSCSLSLQGLGPRTLTASFSQTSDFSGSSASEPHSVIKAATSTRITANTPDPSQVGQPYSVAVSVSSANAVPDGAVSVSDGVSSCSAALAGGSGACSLSSGGAGLRALTATYPGSASFEPSGDSAAHRVDPAATQARILRSWPNPSPVSASTRVDFEVLPVAPGGGVAAGSVVISAGPGESCSAPVAVGRCTLALEAAGPGDLQLQFAGSADHLPASAAAVHQVSADALFASSFEAFEQ